MILAEMNDKSGAYKRPEAIRENKQGKKIKYIINRKQSFVNKLS